MTILTIILATTAFNQIDHPLIIIAEAILFVAMLRLFFALRRSSAPLPQIIALLGFTIAANLVGRVTQTDWFFMSDISMYVLWAAVTVASVMTVLHHQRLEAKRPNAAVVVSDFFDRWQTRATWMAGLFVAGFVVYGYVRSYLDAKRTDAKVEVAVTRENTRVVREFTKKQSEVDAQRDTIVSTVQNIVTGLASVSATQQTILAGVLAPRQHPALLVRKSKSTGRVIIDAPFIEHKQPSKEINRPVEAPAPVQEKKGFFKRLFSVRPNADADTLARY